MFSGVGKSAKRSRRLINEIQGRAGHRFLDNAQFLQTPQPPGNAAIQVAQQGGSEGYEG